MYMSAKNVSRKYQENARQHVRQNVRTDIEKNDRQYNHTSEKVSDKMSVKLDWYKFGINNSKQFKIKNNYDDNYNF